ncbi:MAG: sulfatase-like hydrolase/transferase, partial [Candidatus Omnitrophica bacterium]|nr:sulfatase-like hydrolase/transferase [Candidatus Omnitrophota bacterium]
DTIIGKLYSELRSAGILDTTALFITSDHGENLGEHKPFTHGGPIPWDSLIKTPLIISYPPLFKKNHTENRFTEAIDIMPTILDMCRIPLPPGKRINGISLRWYLNHFYAAKKAVYSLHAIRTAGYKYVIDKKMLFDLKNDPYETKNIADKKPATVHYLTKLYMKTIFPEIKTAKYSRKKLPPDYAFYIPIYSFTADPENQIQTDEFPADSPRDPAHKEYSPKPWAYRINKEFILRTSLYRVPNTPAIPLKLSAEMPNSAYRIYILLKTNQKLTLPGTDIGLRYSFTSPDSQKIPLMIEETTLDNRREEFYYYADIGIATVKNRDFSLTLNFQPAGNAAYEICSIKFVSLRAENNIPLPDEIENQRQRLQSLGYM